MLSSYPIKKNPIFFFCFVQQISGLLDSTAVYHFQAVGGSFQAKDAFFFLLDFIPSTNVLSDMIILDNAHKKSWIIMGRRVSFVLHVGWYTLSLSQQKHCLVYGKKSLLMLHVTYLYLSMTASFKGGAQNWSPWIEHLLHLVFWQDVFHEIVCDTGCNQSFIILWLVRISVTLTS